MGILSKKMMPKRVRARAGEVLATMRERGERQKPGGNKRPGTKIPDGDFGPTLSDLGVTPKQSSQWQRKD